MMHDFFTEDDMKRSDDKYKVFLKTHPMVALDNSKNYFKKPFVNLRIPYIVTNSNKAMRKYKNNENIVVLSAYDNWEQTTFVNPTHETSATMKSKVCITVKLV